MYFSALQEPVSCKTKANASHDAAGRQTLSLRCSIEHIRIVLWRVIVLGATLAKRAWLVFRYG